MLQTLFVLNFLRQNPKLSLKKWAEDIGISNSLICKMYMENKIWWRQVSRPMYCVELKPNIIIVQQFKRVLFISTNHSFIKVIRIPFTKKMHIQYGDVYYRKIHKLSLRWEEFINNNGNYVVNYILIIIINTLLFLFTYKTYETRNMQLSSFIFLATCIIFLRISWRNILNISNTWKSWFPNILIE